MIRPIPSMVPQHWSRRTRRFPGIEEQLTGGATDYARPRCLWTGSQSKIFQRQVEFIDRSTALIPWSIAGKVLQVPTPVVIALAQAPA
jgi:hypothetical protein